MVLTYFTSGYNLEKLSLWVTGLEVHSEYLLPNQSLLPMPDVSKHPQSLQSEMKTTPAILPSPL